VTQRGCRPSFEDCVEIFTQVREIVRSEEETMRSETELVQDFAQQATYDLQSVLPALQVSARR